MCNQASTRSPERARDYMRLRDAQRQAEDASAEPLQRVRVLAGGMSALVRLASKQPDIDMKKLFSAHYLQYC